MKNTVFVHFANHFDLVWRRCWDREYTFRGGRYRSYRQIQELCLQRNIELAEAGRGAYLVEQTLTVRAYLETHPDARERMQALYKEGLFELLGGGEAIIDVNLCTAETMCRNLASGVHYGRHELGMQPSLAIHNDGFGSSAQFPQVIRRCGLKGVQGLAYAKPDNLYWRGLDGSVVIALPDLNGANYFFDHCYHEPCRVCRNQSRETCTACNGTGLDMPQNTYPPLEPVAPGQFKNHLAQYWICSEEMLPPEDMTDVLRRWEAEDPEVEYRWGTHRLLKPLWEEAANRVDNPPPDQVASGVENNPVQSGCHVSRIRIKQRARRYEARFYGWEMAVAATWPEDMETEAWAALFLELPLFFFHDAITGTHQDEAFEELMDRIQAADQATVKSGVETLRSRGIEAKEALLGDRVPEEALLAFNPSAASQPMRIPLPVTDWRTTPCLVAEDTQGRTWPVVMNSHRWSPPLPLLPNRLITGVGPGARTRPDRGDAWVEVNEAAPLAWSTCQLRAAPAPEALTERKLQNAFFDVVLGDHGVEEILDRNTGRVIRGEDVGIGALQIEDDEGDPWGTRFPSTFSHALTPFTHFMGAMQFTGYQEAYYAGRYDPNVRFGHEGDPNVFALEWYVTVRLLEQSQRVDFGFEIYWKGCNRRLRAVFPVQARTDRAWYSIPGGWLERPRYEQTETCLWSPNGDWPAVHFTAASSDEASGWAVVNYGTPSARVADGRILMSLLRSPGFGACLERYAQDYPMPTEGQRDPGWHHFMFSLLPYAGEPALPELAATAAALNQLPPVALVEPGTVLPPSWLQLEAEGIEILAMKRPFAVDETGMIIRLLNLKSTAGTARLVLTDAPQAVVTECLMTEEHQGNLPLCDGVCELAFTPFEIKTLRVD
ncbi:MAG: hypothetical protein HQ523_13185 [Lentisphaerae bacterium]|nr:hypothetical protein [Lentisphaerota bacterium]